ncbi:MAG: hypothetical protein K2Y22_04710 [Candidatus Obscuribacterales bacterium]|nr:hypothetical protein [Candidatus Obscuribacterales bacterium]
MQPIALATTCFMLVGLIVSSVLPADAQFRQRSFERFSTGDYMARNKELQRRISDARRQRLITVDEANSLENAVRQQAHNFRIMRQSDGFLSGDELTALETLLSRTAASLDNMISTRPSPRRFSYRNTYWS